MLRDTLLFFLILTALHFIVRAVRSHYVFDSPKWWPLSIFNPRSPTLADIAAAVLVSAGFAAVLWRGEKTKYRSAAEVALFGTLLILGTNAVQGMVNGFVRPTNGGTIQYYHDAAHHTESPAVFLRRFDQIQPTLGDHGRTHPPGAILLFRLLGEITGNRPAAISVVIAIAASLLTVYFFRLLLAAVLPNASQNAGAILLLLLPAVQIYYCATLDALIASLLLGVVGLFAISPTPGRIAGSTCCLIAVSFLTFGFVWVVPLLLIVETNRWAGRTSVLRLTALFGGLIAFYLILSLGFGSSYLHALRTATHLENPQGFRLLTEPLSYLFTRLEDVCEIAFFTGPVLLSLTFGNLKDFRRDHPFAWRLYAAALGTLAILFLTGAYHTGETARACLFLCPYLLLPVIAQSLSEPTKRRWILSTVFAQALLMQLLGRYFW